MYALHEENQKLEQRQEDLGLILAQAQYVNVLDDALDAQVCLKFQFRVHQFINQYDCNKTC